MKFKQDYEFFEIEEQKSDSGIYPDLLEHLNLFNQVSKISVSFAAERTTLSIKLEDGTWSFFVFYDIGCRSLNKEAHEKFLNSFCFYLENMA